MSQPSAIVMKPGDNVATAILELKQGTVAEVGIGTENHKFPETGSMPIQGVLAYGERPSKPGLYFVEAWMSSLSLPLGYAASGAHLFLYQMGGGGLADLYPPMPAVSSGIVIPLMYITGNRQTFEKSNDSMDFDSSPVMEGKESLVEAGDRLLKRVL